MNVTLVILGDVYFHYDLSTYKLTYIHTIILYVYVRAMQFYCFLHNNEENHGQEGQHLSTVQAKFPIVYIITSCTLPLTIDTIPWHTHACLHTHQPSYIY